MNKWKITSEQAVQELEKIIAQIQNGTFEGVLAFSNLQREIGFVIAEKGFAEDRINVIDGVFYSIYEEPNIEARKWTMEEMCKRWLHYFPDLSFITKTKT